MWRAGPIALLALCACSLIPCHPYRLEPGPGRTQANLALEDRPSRHGQEKDGKFIGIAMSGGGSRAANFAAAVLLHLRRLGILDRADYLSPVSGSALPAVYYALEGYEFFSVSRGGRRAIRFEEEELKDRLYPHFQFWYAARWFLPWNIARYWLTSFNRTDIMFGVLDDFLFHEATFADLNPAGPKLLINATDREDLERFDLTAVETQPYGLADSAYRRFIVADERVYGAALTGLPLSVPATASLAVPGLFQDVILEIPPATASAGAPGYLHLVDGMVTDNQGLLTLLEILQQAVKEHRFNSTFPEGCVLISIDASPNYHHWARDEDDTRREYKDYLFDRNLADAVDYVLLRQREQILKMIGYSSHDVLGKVRVKRFTIVPNAPAETAACDFWHIALRHIEIVDAAGRELAWYPTELDITREQQAFLYGAACEAVKMGWDEGAKDFFGGRGAVDCFLPAGEAR